ncbi:hypothetical protein Tco_0800854 [Tanacetum coccineum]|uniref:Uncharacterized protein n=1 Tax=Tanacetum coccineum TaxID=301880 RepID=A0ABQ4ZX22_9ASTR
MSSYNHPGCSCCGGPFNGGNCLSCSSVEFGNEFVYDLNPYSYNETPYAGGKRGSTILDEHFELKLSKLTHAVNQQTSDVTTAMTGYSKTSQATPPPASVKAVEEICVTCGGAYPSICVLPLMANTLS